jgi:hypothetical protein
MHSFNMSTLMSIMTSSSTWWRLFQKLTLNYIFSLSSFLLWMKIKTLISHSTRKIVELHTSNNFSNTCLQVTLWLIYIDANSMLNTVLNSITLFISWFISAHYTITTFLEVFPQELRGKQPFSDWHLLMATP